MSTNEETQPDFPPGIAPKMLSLVNSVNNLEQYLSKLVEKPHHDVLAKVSS